jgi:NAD(P)-dependent dehydrogenase (short-subunit alcohol dehydrogenase family)
VQNVSNHGLGFDPDQPIRALVVGASGGIGRALTTQLAADQQIASVLAWSRRPRPSDDDAENAKITHASVDITDEASIIAGLAGVTHLDLVIVATGLLHDTSRQIAPEKTWRSLDADQMARSFAVNTIGPALLAKHTLPLFPRDRRAIYAALSARVGSIGDNRLGGWHSYRAAKAALNQIIRTLAIELARTHKQTVCVGLHPGTVATGLSKPFQSGVTAEKLFTPEQSATYLLGVIGALTPAHSGNIFAWDGQVIAP